MAGLLNIDFEDPETAGLLGLAGGLFAAGAPSRTRISNGQAIMAGLQGMQQGQQGAQQYQYQKKLHDAQLAMAQLKEKRDQTDFENKQNWLRNFSGGGQSQGGMQGNQQGANPQSGVAGMSIDQLAQASILGIPGAKELFEMKKYADNGVERKTNTTYRNPITGKDEYIADPTKGMDYDPTTKTITPITGYSNTNAQIKGAETAATEAAKAASDLVELDLANGGKIKVTRAQALQMANPQIQQAQQQPTQLPDQVSGAYGLDLSKVSPQQMQALQAQDPEAFYNGVNNFAQTRGQGVQAQQQPQGQSGFGIPLQTEAQKQMQLAGVKLQTEPVLEQQTGLVKGRQGTNNALNENWIKQSYNPVLDAGKSSRDILGGLDALKGIDLNTGWGTEAKATAANVLTSLGIAPKNAEMFATNVQKFQSVAMGKLLDTLAAQKGPQTEGDSTRAQQTFAMLKNTPQANQFIADFARAKANQDVRKASFYQDSLPIAQQTGDLNEIDRRWKKIQGSIWDDPALQIYRGGK